MTKQPRKYQLEAIDETMKYIGRGIYSGVVQLPTGTGKSLVQQELVRRHFPIEKYRSILIGGLSRSLNYQGLEGFRYQYPETAYAVERNNRLYPGSGIVMAQHDDYDARLVVASAQTVGPKTLQETRKRILENMQIEKSDVTRSKNGGILLSPNSKRQYLVTPRFDEILKHGKIDLWIHDEAHHAPADSTLWMVRQLNTIYEHLGEEPLRHVGFTATPFRADERALSNVYEIMYFERDYAWAVENGYIVPIVDSNGTQGSYDLVDIMSEHGKSERLKVVENWMERVYEGYMDRCHGKRKCTCTFVGPINGMGAVEASRELHGYFNDRGVPTVHVDGTYWIDTTGTKRPNSERKHLWNALNDGRVPHIVNFGVMIEGIDVPIIDAIQIIRSMNAVTFTQAAGRASRNFHGKRDALVIDYTGQELVQMMVGQLSGVKIDSFKQLIEVPKIESDTENEDDINERTGRSMRDQSQEGYVQGVNNIYKEAKIKRHSDMVWFKDFPGSINWSMSVTRSDKDAGTRSSSFLITLPQHTESNYYASIAAELPEGKLRNTAQTLADILRNFTLWHTMEGDAWETLPNGHRYRPHIVVRNSDNEVYQKSMPEFDRLEEATSRYAKTVPGYDKSIAAKGADWRRKDYPMSAPQERFFVGLMPTLDPNQYNKSHGASMITHMLAESAVYRILNNAKKAVKDATR